MEINLSWDLFIIVFFTIIVTYTFIIGRNQSVKIIISTYIAILAADSIGNILQKYFLGSNPAVKIMSFEDIDSTLVLLKIAIFILCIIIITTKGKFHINIGKNDSAIMRMFFSLSYGILSAGLIISTLLIYASGTSLIQASDVVINQAVLVLYKDSELVRLMINNYNIWFSLPAIAFVVSSFFGEEE